MIIFSTLRKPVKTFHPASGYSFPLVRTEYSIDRIQWRNGRVTFHLSTAHYYGEVRDPWSGASYGDTASKAIAESWGIDWAAQCEQAGKAVA